MSWLTRSLSPAESILSLAEPHNANNLKHKDLSPLLYPMPYKTPNTDLNPILGKGLAKALVFFTGTFNPSSKAQGILQGIASHPTPVLAFPPVMLRWVLLGVLSSRDIRHHYAPKNNKESSNGFKGRGICSPGWGGWQRVRKSQASITFNDSSC